MFVNGEVDIVRQGRQHANCNVWERNGVRRSMILVQHLVYQ